MDIFVEESIHFDFERVETAVGVDILVAAWHEMDGADAIVEGKGIEIWIGRTPRLIEVIDFHRSEQVDFAAIHGSQSVDFFKIRNSVVFAHIA